MDGSLAGTELTGTAKSGHTPATTPSAVRRQNLQTNKRKEKERNN